MTSIAPLNECIKELVNDGDCVALEGFTHLIPHAAGHELIRQGCRDLTVVRLTPDVISDQLVGAGVVSKLVFSWGGNPGVGSLHRFRDAVENGRPLNLEIEEHTHAGLAARFTAGASAVTFALAPGYRGTDLIGRTTVRELECPFSGNPVTVVPALNPDVAIVHAQQADRLGNVLLWGIVGVQKEAILASKRTIVTVEEVVDELVPRPFSVFIPNRKVDAVAPVQGGAHPSYALDYSRRDNQFYRRWDEISRDFDQFEAWIERHILSTEDCAGYLKSLDTEGSIA